MNLIEKSFHKNGVSKIAGVDEVGRGPLAGPVVACALMLYPDSSLFKTKEIRDSKALSPKAREEKYWEIVQFARIGLGVVNEREIDEINILQASLLAMRKAVLALSTTPQIVLIDGNQEMGAFPLEQLAIIDGDKKVLSIAFASIIAKVTRDKMMEKYDQLFPQYGFSKHKGYPTEEHISNLNQFGPSPIHRKSFEPVFRSARRQP